MEPYREQATEELAAQGVAILVECGYAIISGSRTALDAADVLKDACSERFSGGCMS